MYKDSHCHAAVLANIWRLQGIGGIAPQQIAALAQQQQLQNLTQQLQSQLSLSNMNLTFFNQVRPAPSSVKIWCHAMRMRIARMHTHRGLLWRGLCCPLEYPSICLNKAEVSGRAAHHRYACRL